MGGVTNRAAMYLGTLAGIALAVEIIRTSRDGSLAEVVLAGGAPWTTIGLIGGSLLLLALGAPRSGRALGACVAGGFAVAAVDPSAAEPSATILPYTALALVAGVAALSSHHTAAQVPVPRRPATSSRQINAAIRAHRRRAAT